MEVSWKHIPAFFSPEHVETLRGLAAEGNFVDGRVTARGMAPEVKKNLQLEPSEDVVKQLGDVMAQALSGSRDFQTFALPRRLLTPMISRYTEGMYYDRHLDSPMMGAGQPLRTDLSVTVFLSPLDSYDGGELVLETAEGDEAIKLPPGDAVVYDTRLFHHVTEVTRGERLALVTWVQSLIQSPEERQVARDLNECLRQVREVAPDSEVADLLHISVNNLMRMWAR